TPRPRRPGGGCLSPPLAVPAPSAGTLTCKQQVGGSSPPPAPNTAGRKLSGSDMARTRQHGCHSSVHIARQGRNAGRNIGAPSGEVAGRGPAAQLAAAGELQLAQDRRDGGLGRAGGGGE